MATLWPCTENLRGQLNIYDALFGPMRWETDNGRALTLAQLTRGTAHVVALGGRTYDHGPARWRNRIGRGSAGQHHHHRTGRMVGQRVGILQIIGR